MPAGGPFTVRVAGKNTITLGNVLVGEVWLCSGQSNMEMAVASCINAHEEIAAANHPQIRHIQVPKLTASVPAKDFPGQWQVCSPETAGGFTACGYFMARELQKKLNVPVGLVHSSWGGTRIEPWTTPAGFAQVPALADIQEMIAKADPHSAEYKDGLAKYLDKLRRGCGQRGSPSRRRISLHRCRRFPRTTFPWARHPDPQGQPTTLYNAMIHPLVPFGIRGAIWYQGESNHVEGKLYTEKMKALIQGWRQLWGRELPFYYVQIAPFPYGNESPAVLAELWEAQSAALEIPNTGMVVTSDIGDYNDIHPKNKQEVGRRLACLALKNVYGQSDVVCSGPTFKSMAIEGDKIRIRFDNVGGGLVSRNDKPLGWFEIIGRESDWSKADAAIEGDSVVLSSDKVKAPAAMRFAWDKSARPNLMNQEGLPASAFRSGKEPQIDIALKVSESKDYELLYSLDLTKANRTIVYDVDRRAQIAGPIDRVAYFLELRKHGGPTQWVYVSMDAFTNDLAKLGVPTVASKAKFQTPVTRMNVLSNDPRITTGADLAGNIEFFPNNYGPLNAAKVPNASDAVWDFGDQIAEPEDGYGSMQVHNFAAKQTIFAFNNWKAGPGADLGIGNSDPRASGGQTLDWTFNANASQYVVKQLKVLVRLKK